jgi:cysteine desulfurase/selenocysteine lyase
VLTPEPPELRAGIVTFRVEEPEALMERLESGRIVVSLRDGLVRVSPHFWNTEGEIDRLLAALRPA